MEIMFTYEYTDKDGQRWYEINGHACYPLGEWTRKSADADYLYGGGWEAAEWADRMDELGLTA